MDPLQEPQTFTPGLATLEPGPTRMQRVAPLWHTLVLILVVVGFSFASANSQHRFSAAHGRVVLYGMTMGWEWVMVGYILLGIRKRSSVRELIGGRWASLNDALKDCAVAVGFWVLAYFVLAITGAAMGLAHPNQVAEAKQKIAFLVPHGGLELTMFMALSATAGFCEEIIFRGYLQRQFAALTQSVVWAVALQGVVFGAGHAYEGSRRMVLIGIYGIMFGVLATMRRSLRPGMLAHFLHDGFQGLLLRRLMQ